MKVAVIGLGKMGLNISHRLMNAGHTVVAFDINSDAVKAAAELGAQGADSLEKAVTLLEQPRVFWVMLPAGKITDDTLDTLSGYLAAGDILIDGGNSNYKDSMQQAQKLAQKGITLLDVGVSGGVWGLSEGYSMMVGGPDEAVAHCRPLFETLAPAPDQGWAHVGPSGSGHYVKMVHNGIEYGLMQAYAEGFEVLKTRQEFGLDLHQVAEVWRFGSVIRSWLLDLVSETLADEKTLSEIQPWVPDSGEGRWTAAEAIDLGVPAPVITLALQMRFASRDEKNFSAVLVAAMRNKFGGHAVKTNPEA